MLWVDGKPQIQALKRTAPSLLMQPGNRTPDYIRRGASTLFVALEIATGYVMAACKPRHRRQAFLAFLKPVAQVYSEGPLHLVMDNYAVYKTSKMKAWLADNPRFRVHFIPTLAS